MSRGVAQPAVWARAGLTIRPANDVAERMLRSVTAGGEFVGHFRNVRSTKQLRLWWGLMAILVDHGVFPLSEAASDAVKIGCGHVEPIIMPDTGEVFLRPKSIAFESLAQDAFNPIMEAALDVICARWIPGVGKEALRREVFRAIDGPGAIGERVR